MARQYSNTSRSMTLVSGVSSVAATITVDDATGLPSTFPYNLVIDPDTAQVEIVEVSAAAGAVLTIGRGQQDTTGSTHAAGATVQHVWTALDGQELQTHLDATTNVHGVGVGVSVVGTSTAQTLTNKTISGADNTLTNIPSSAISGGNLSISGTVQGSSFLNSSGLPVEYASVWRTTDVGRSNTTSVSDDAVLMLPVAANARYRLQASVFWSKSATASQGIKHTWSTPSGTTGYWVAHAVGNAASARLTPDAVANSLGTGSSAGEYYLGMEGLFLTAGTSGFIAFSWAQAVSEATAVSVLQNSWLELRRVG